MRNKKKWIVTAILLIIVLFIRLISSNPALTERYYSTGIYPYISAFFRWLFGWLPFSLGDILYGLTGAWILWKLWTDIKILFNGKFTGQLLVKKSLGTIDVVLIIYITFNLLWGINYNRQGIATQLGLTMGKYSTEELKIVNSILLQKVNETKSAVIRRGDTIFNKKEIFNRSVAAYDEVSKKFPFLQYYQQSIKTSMWGWLGNYMGFNGYYNPFTGEAQVNTTVPKFLQPYTTCHEMAHQLGYAKENEANFIGYLSASASKDTVFLYSVYLDLFLYADRNLYGIDSSAAKSFARQLLPEVKADIQQWRKFNLSHQSFVEPAIRWMYGKYLQSNQQPSGVLSYDEVTAFLVAYYRKFDTL